MYVFRYPSCESDRQIHLCAYFTIEKKNEKKNQRNDIKQWRGESENVRSMTGFTNSSMSLLVCDLEA